jgi:hypothetical protein
MSGIGKPYDNATTESFFKTLNVAEFTFWNIELWMEARSGFPFSFKRCIIKKYLPSSLEDGPSVEFEGLFSKNKNSWTTALTQSV